MRKKRFLARNADYVDMSILVFLPVRGWGLVIFMMCLGISLKFIPGVPTEFFASFYCGLGPALITAGAQFLSKWIEAGKE